MEVIFNSSPVYWEKQFNGELPGYYQLSSKETAHLVVLELQALLTSFLVEVVLAEGFTLEQVTFSFKDLAELSDKRHSLALICVVGDDPPELCASAYSWFFEDNPERVLASLGIEDLVGLLRRRTSWLS